LPLIAQDLRVEIGPQMVTNEGTAGEPAGMVDEQRAIIGPPAGKPASSWTIPSTARGDCPFNAYIDLGEEKELSKIWFFDTNGKGDVTIAGGEPGDWHEIATYDCGAYMKWAAVQLDTNTRYLRLTKKSIQANFSEVAVYEYTEEAYEAMLARKAAEEKARLERIAELRKAREEALKRPIIEMAPYGRLSLVEEIDCSDDTGDRMFSQHPENSSRVEDILERKCRVLPPTTNTATYFRYRIGRRKLLRANGVYVIVVDYPEDQPRSMVVINTGNETAKGMHTGRALGDALHPKYVNNFVESLDIPLSGKWETWSLLFRLHDRYPQRSLVHGDKQRDLTPEEGIDVTIAQFSAKNIPMSEGAAVSRIRLFEVIDVEQLTNPMATLPEKLPKRRIFWREEMADGVLGAKNTNADERGLKDRLDWYRHKAELMRFLGINTYTKDLLEFGACQHWDSAPYGGNKWVYHDGVTKNLWADIVELMGQYGFDVMPYYEYSGSKGSAGLGFQRRCKPLTRDDAYTHIKWVESSNADITDPDTYEDFKKVLDATLIRFKKKANFAGAWIRSRGQMPVSFGSGALKRFAEEANGTDSVTRDDLKTDKSLYDRYVEWWELKRLDFLAAMRDYLRENGVDAAVVLFTGLVTESGAGFGDFEPRFVTDSPAVWAPILKQKVHQPGHNRSWETLTPQQVISQGLYLKGLLSPGLNWGGYEVNHARPGDDPLHYKDVEGVMLSHAFNRSYTTLSPETLDTYRTPAGLTIVRHFSLNENMMFDKNDNSILGYFVADIERAGPYCMMAEALAMANGDPTMIGYLVGCNFGRAFPEYVRNFNASFLALPALPSNILRDVSDNPAIVVRAIETAAHGTWHSLVNTALNAVDATITLPGKDITDAVTGEPIPANGSELTATFYPCELKAWHSR